MPHRPHVAGPPETGLAECFQYHNALDSFVLRAEVTASSVGAAGSGGVTPSEFGPDIQPRPETPRRAGSPERPQRWQDRG